MSYIDQEKHASTPATPSVNFTRLYPKDVAGVTRLFYKDDAGNEYMLGQGLIAGGTANQVLAKVTNADYDVAWTNVTASGVTSINSQTGAVTIATGTTGTNFNIAAAAGTVTLNLPVASATNTGKLSSTDWTTFNNKVDYVTSIVNALIFG